MFLVVRYVNNLPEHEYGVSDTYTLVGAFTDKDVAEKVKNSVASEMLHNGIVGSVEVKEIEVNKQYQIGNEPFLGGASYLE